jgi:hypothetical protein
MGKVKYIIGGAVLAVLLLLLIFVWSAYQMLTGSTTTPAYLNVESGKVEVDIGKGWVPAQEEMELGLDDKVRTGSDGYASLVLHESAIVSLEPNTEVVINDLDTGELQVKQGKGTTWNKFTGLAGVESLSVETPNTVATVRGTSFEVNADDSGTDDSVLVGEGQVEVSTDGEVVVLGENEKAVLENALENAVGSGGAKQLRPVKKQLTAEEKRRMLLKIEKNVQRMKKMREHEIKKKEIVVKQLQKQFDVTDDEMKKFFAEADQGKQDLVKVEKDFKAKVPVKIESLSKVRAITEKIAEENKKIERLRQAAPAKEPVAAEKR